MAKLKAEFLQHWHDAHGIPFRTRIIAYLPSIYRILQIFPRTVNLVMRSGPLAGALKRVIGFHPGRSMPLLAKRPLSAWMGRNLLTVNPAERDRKGYVYLFNDEFTNHLDTGTGINAIRLLSGLGYAVKIAGRTISGRTFLSRGLLRKARTLARTNVKLYGPLVSHDHPLIGIEPSAILGFRDEYPDLVGDDLRASAIRLGADVLLIEEFLEREMRAGRISKDDFTREKATVLLHGHCQQKAVASTLPTVYILNFPENHSCTEIPSGCCGMAGAFGFEKEHFDLSMKVGELVLFPAVREAPENTIICAPGTSCRHHIFDGTGRTALHPADVLYRALSAGRSTRHPDPVNDD